MDEIDRTAAEQEATAQNAEQHGEAVGEGVPEEAPVAGEGPGQGVQPAGATEGYDPEAVQAALKTLATMRTRETDVVFFEGQLVDYSIDAEGVTTARIENFQARHITEDGDPGNDGSLAFFPGVHVKAIGQLRKEPFGLGLDTPGISGG